MRRNYSFWLASAMLTLAIWCWPYVSSANTATPVSIDPTATDITDTVGDAPPADVYFRVYAGVIDTTYTATFLVDAEPAMVVVTGGDSDAWTYDSATQLVTVTAIAKGFADEAHTLPDGTVPFGIAMIWPVALGEDGPPEEMTGGWMATDLQQWQLVPPSPDTPYFGYILTGTPGTSGFFKMFIPDGIITLLSQLSGKTLTYQDLAVFEDDAQTGFKITQVTGGALVSINVTFPETSDNETIASASVTKEIVVKPRPTISLQADDTSISTGDSAKLYGWLANGKKNKKVVLWSTAGKASGTSTYTKVMIVKTKKNGKFTFNVSPTTKTTYQATYKGNTSETVTITVN